MLDNEEKENEACESAAGQVLGEEPAEATAAMEPVAPTDEAVEEVEEPEGEDTEKTALMEPVEPAEEASVEPAAEGADDDAPIVDAIGVDNDDSGLDYVSVPVIGAAGEGEVAAQAGSAQADASAEGAAAEGDEDEGKKSHVARNVIIAILVVIVLVVACFVGWLAYDDSKNASRHVPAGVTLDGANIGGLTEEEVSSVVTKHLVSGTAGSVTLKLSNGNNIELEYARMGDVDVDGTVEAVMATIEPSMANRMIERAKGLVGMGSAPQPVELVTVCKLSKKRVTAKIQALADSYDVEMQNAGYKFDSDKYRVVTTKARTGYEIDVKATTKAVLAANKNGEAEVAAVDKVVEPARTKPGQAIFVSLSECHLYFYVDGKVSKDYPCTPGMSGYDTPSGDWTLEYKDSAPTWYNPHSDWSKNMPETIGPGASNPLGLRALAVSCGGGIYIHGTQNYAQLGSTGSHGCVRLANENVVELFDLVETGIPIFIH